MGEYKNNIKCNSAISITTMGYGKSEGDICFYCIRIYIVIEYMHLQFAILTMVCVNNIVLSQQY